MTLTLIAQPEENRDLTLSTSARYAILASVLRDSVFPGDPSRPAGDASRTPGNVSRTAAAISLAAALDVDPGDLTPGERGLLRQLLSRSSR